VRADLAVHTTEVPPAEFFRCGALLPFEGVASLRAKPEDSLNSWAFCHPRLAARLKNRQPVAILGTAPPRSSSVQEPLGSMIGCLCDQREVGGRPADADLPEWGIYRGVSRRVIGYEEGSKEFSFPGNLGRSPITGERSRRLG